MNIPVQIKLLNPLASVPTYAHVGDSGVDLRSVEDYTIKPNEVVLVSTGIALQFEAGYEAQVRPRSGMATKRRLSVANTPGTIDSTYRGEIKVALVNQGNVVQQVSKGERIAQLVFVPVLEADFEVVEDFHATTRGDGGFGSTGEA